MHAEESTTLESHEGIKPATGVQWERNLVTTSRPGETSRRYVGQGRGGGREKEIKSSATAAEDNSTQQIGWIRKVKERKTARTVRAF
jgi:hypothetical protein